MYIPYVRSPSRMDPATSQGFLEIGEYSIINGMEAVYTELLRLTRQLLKWFASKLANPRKVVGLGAWYINEMQSPDPVQVIMY